MGRKGPNIRSAELKLPSTADFYPTPEAHQCVKIGLGCDINPSRPAHGRTVADPRRHRQAAAMPAR